MFKSFYLKSSSASITLPKIGMPILATQIETKPETNALCQ